MFKKKQVLVQVESSRVFGRLLAKGIATYAKHCERWILYREAAGREELNKLVTWRPDGVIAHVSDTSAARRVIPPNTPAVVKGIRELIPDVCNIVGDTEAVGIMAAEHLMSRGYKHFAFCGFKDMLWSIECEHYFRQRLTKENLKVLSFANGIEKISRNWKAEIEALITWILSLPKPVAIMACNDDRAQHVVEACNMAGIRIPYEVGVIGCDNDELICTLTPVPLTSITLNSEQVGYEAAALLDQLMSGAPMKDQKILMRPTGIVIRHSTDIYHIDDTEVVRALVFIRKYYQEPIQADNVVNATDLSRTALYNRFKKQLGISISEELRRVRVEHIAQMLVETNLPISRIVSDCVYTSERNVARYFKKQTGLSLYQYRKRYNKNM